MYGEGRFVLRVRVLAARRQKVTALEANRCNDCATHWLRGWTLGVHEAALSPHLTRDQMDQAELFQRQMQSGAQI